MRFERWYWLIVFCVVSVVVHGLLGYSTKSYGLGSPLPPQRHDLEITLQSGPEQKPTPPKPLPAPVAKTTQPEPTPKREEVPAETDQRGRSGENRRCQNGVEARTVRADSPQYGNAACASACAYPGQRHACPHQGGSHPEPRGSGGGETCQRNADSAGRSGRATRFALAAYHCYA